MTYVQEEELYMESGDYKESFARIETKYHVPCDTYGLLLEELKDYIKPDVYGDTRIYNIYYDTPDYRLIRRSIEKPVYKEKLRLRTYKVPDADTSAFVEIKKKYEGIVYKRRISLPYSEAKRHLDYGIPFQSADHVRGNVTESFTDTQIEHEIDSMVGYYKRLRPGMIISYDRLAFQGIEDPGFRVTFDKNIRWRDSDMDLRSGGYGTLILPEEERLMEIKIAGAMPIEIARILSKLNIYKTSFSKYGRGYARKLELERRGIRKYA